MSVNQFILIECKKVAVIPLSQKSCYLTNLEHCPIPCRSYSHIKAKCFWKKYKTKTCGCKYMWVFFFKTITCNNKYYKASKCLLFITEQENFVGVMNKFMGYRKLQTEKSGVYCSLWLETEHS